jgi:plastocyanin
MKKILLLGLSLTFFSSAWAAVQEIDISDMQFNPNVIDINQGDTVRWINRDTVPHVIQGSFATSPDVGVDGRFEFTFTEAGNFDYICSLHPSMTGTIRVAAVTEITNDEPVSGGFSDLFGTGSSFQPEDLASVNQSFEAPTAPPENTFNEPVVAMEAPSEAVISNPSPAPVVNTANIQTPTPTRTVTASAGGTLPTAGGDNWYVYLSVLLVVGGMFFLTTSNRR